MRPRIDLLPVGACLIAVLMTALYLFLVSAEGSRPTTWAVVLLVGGGLGAGYASSRRAPLRRVVLGVSAALLGALGYVAVLSVGMPLLLAAALCIIAVVRGRPAKDWRDSV